MDEIEIRLASYDSPDAQRLIGAALSDLAARYGGEGDETPVAAAEFEPPSGAFLIAYLAGKPVGCGAWRSHDDVAEPGAASEAIAAGGTGAASGAGGTAELKRMYTVPEARGRGVARRVLAAVERSAREQGRKRLILECGVQQPEAIALYEASGYQRIPNFGFYRDSPDCLSYGRTLTEL